MDVGPVDVTIDLLSVEGLGAPDPAVLQAAVERHITALVSRDGAPWATNRARADLVVELDWDGRGGGDGLARALAHGIHRALRR